MTPTTPLFQRMLVALCAALGGTGLAHGQDAFPAKSIRIIVAFAPGGVADTVARLVGQKISDRLGQPVLVENRGGAGGSIASKAVAAAPADGYTLLVNTAAFAAHASLSKEPGYDPVADFAPVAIAATTPTVFVFSASVPADNLQAFIKGAAGKRITFSSAGVGTTPHLTAEYVFKTLAKLDAVHVPFQGGPLAITAVLSGQVDFVTTSMPPAVPLIKQGKMRALAVASKTRSPVLPDVPTLAEQGLPDVEDHTWIAFLAPAKTRNDVVQKLNAEVNDAIRQPDVRDRLTALGFSAQGGTTAQFADYLKQEVAKWARIVKETGFTAN